MELFRVDKENPFKGPHQNHKTASGGVDLSDAKFAMIMIHGRGASAESIIGLGNEFETNDKITFMAPQASGFTWYPYSFLAPTEKNQPGLNSGLQAISDLIVQIEKEGISKENIFLLGFSQGACLATEFVARHPGKYAGVIGLSGGLIGDEVDPSVYSGDLEGTPVFLGCSDIDPHIPKERVDETEAAFEKLGGKVTKKIYPGMGHLVNEDEIQHIQQLLNSKLKIQD
ncbi:MAG: dienelactone hydrolase family protein [Balneola sp.]|jgi:phospholipase/carboxylesterase